MDIVSIYLTNSANIGDQVCCPFDYFTEFEKVTSCDINSLEKFIEERGTHDKVFVIGGGGLLHVYHLDILWQLAQRKLPVVIWGAGTNIHDCKAPVFPNFINEFNLIGLRDYTEANTWEYVPCPSCLHSIFDLAQSKICRPIHEQIIYEHQDFPIPENLPKMSNKGSGNDFETVIRFLGTGKEVITNSYHGAYWAMLLNLKVRIYKPFSNRFEFLNNCPLYLQGCQVANTAFAAKVKDLISKL